MPGGGRWWFPARVTLGIMKPIPLNGSVQILILLDVCDGILPDRLRSILNIPAPPREPAFKHSTPEYVRFERPPVIEPGDSFALSGGEPVSTRLKYYDYGVISVEFTVPLAVGWNSLLTLSSRWLAGMEFERRAVELVRARLPVVGPALLRPYENWLREDYIIVQIDAEPHGPTAEQFYREYAQQIAQLLSGETITLAAAERDEILQAHLSYYPTDLTVVAWNVALVYDTPEGALSTIQILEYANSQLLEFRHYDEVLSQELGRVYESLDEGTGFLDRWRLARAATRLQTMLIEITELAERADNSIKFVSDMFSARLYRLAAAKVGVPDYRNLVDQKIHTAEDLYRFMVEQFQHGRAFVMEVMVVIILIIELAFLFRGRG